MEEKEGEKRRTRGNLTSCLGLFSHPLGDRSAVCEDGESERKKENEDQSDVSKGWRK